MMAAVEAANGPAIVVGTDCPALTPEHLRAAARALVDGIDVVIIPVDDGGYGLIGMRRPQPALFEGMTWSTSSVMAETRRRLIRLDAGNLPSVATHPQQIPAIAAADVQEFASQMIGQHGGSHLVACPGSEGRDQGEGPDERPRQPVSFSEMEVAVPLGEDRSADALIQVGARRPSAAYRVRYSAFADPGRRSSGRGVPSI